MAAFVRADFKEVLPLKEGPELRFFPKEAFGFRELRQLCSYAHMLSALSTSRLESVKYS